MFWGGLGCFHGPADIPRFRTTRYGKSTFSYEAAVVWDSLPDSESE